MARAGTTSHLRDSPPPSPISPTPSVSDSDDLTDNVGPSASRPGSPTLLLKLHPNTLEPDDSVTCQWEDCGVVFTHLPTLIDHIHNDHIGVHKPSYTCEWASCQRRGLPQISRYALLSHIRSHTGEKPFTCPRPECDKSFTRSDALAKHMRLQHNTSPPAPGRGGSRKRKRGNDDQPTGSAHLTNTTFSGVPSSTDSTGAGGFSTFKVEPNTPSESFDDIKPPDYFARPQNGRRRSLTPRASSVVDDDEGYTSSSDVLPAHLLPHYVPSTGLVLGRSPAMVMYLLMKAKYKYALDQHESLCEELRVARSELKREKEAKEGALNLVLRGVFGAQAEHLITPIPQPPGISEPESYDPGPNSLSNMNGHTQ